MEFINFILTHAQKCNSEDEIKIQLRLLYNRFHGLMSKEEIMKRPLAAQAVLPSERVDYDDMFERKRIMLYAKSKVKHVFPNLSLLDFLAMPRHLMAYIVRVADDHYKTSQEIEDAEAAALMAKMGLAARNDAIK